jgi:hypothetical protein
MVGYINAQQELDKIAVLKMTLVCTKVVPTWYRVRT